MGTDELWKRSVHFVLRCAAFLDCILLNDTRAAKFTLYLADSFENLLKHKTEAVAAASGTRAP